MKAYLGLGSNIGDSHANILAAIENLKGSGTIEKVSSFYKTEPVGLAEQPWFVNCAAVLETELPPEELLTEAKRIEKELGRTSAARNGPRVIDIDILLYEHIIVKTGSLTVPHPRLHERRFNLLPLSEIAPDAVHPVFERTIIGLLGELKDSHACEKLLH